MDRGRVNLLVLASRECLPQNILHKVHSVAPSNLDEDQELQEPPLEAGMEPALEPAVPAVEVVVDVVAADHEAADHEAADDHDPPHK